MKAPDVSIIVPTCNRKDLLELSLLSFNYQDYRKDKFEVIVVDDGSNDGTCDMIKSLKVNYNLMFLPNEENLGAAFARNVGLKNASGDIIIFSDSDCIVPPNFISGHIKYHKSNYNICPSAVIRWKKVFTKYYEKFNAMQKSEFENAIIDIAPLKSRLKSLSFNYENNFSILYKDDINEIDKYSFVPSWSEGYLGGIIKSFNNSLEYFQYPWIFFSTGNVSIRKEHIIEAGGFDERLRREEDWDLGYRLYKKGIKFVCALELESIHQEHVIISNREDKMIQSYKIIFNKYKDTELFLFCLFLEDAIGISTLSNAVLGYKVLLQNEEKYEPITNKFNFFLQYRVNSFLEKRKKTEEFMDINNELRIIDSLPHKIPSFIKVFKELSRVFV